MDSAIPSCLGDAYRFLNADRAWVACIPCEGCSMSEEAHVHTLASRATRTQVMQAPGCWQFFDPHCPKTDRFAFLMSGLDVLLGEALTEA